MAHLGKFAASGDVDRYLSDAAIFMEMLSYQVIAWQWLKMAIAAHTNLRGQNFEFQTREFYEGKVHTMKFFFRYELPHAESCAKTLMDADLLTDCDTKIM